MNRFAVLILSFLMFTISAFSSTLSIPEYLQSICVRITVQDVRGSGVVFTRKDWTGTNDISFVWTAAHLFRSDSNNFPSPIVFRLNGTNAPTIAHAIVEQPVFKNGKMVSATRILAKLITISRQVEDGGNDLALLQLEKPFVTTNSVVFNLNYGNPHIGDPVCSMSCPYSEWGTYSVGIFSYIGRIINDLVYDQTTCVIYPGSSGGGMFSMDGKYIGMPTIMRAPQINSMIPIRRIQGWAKEHKIEWALDPKLPMPNPDGLKALHLSVITNKVLK